MLSCTKPHELGGGTKRGLFQGIVKIEKEIDSYILL